MSFGSLLWSRFKGFLLKKIKNRNKLQTLLFGMTCLIFFIVLCSEYLLMKNQNIKTYKIWNEPNINRTLIQAIEWVKNIHSRKYVSDIFLQATTVNDEFQFHPDVSNRSVYFFNSSETFRKLFREWLDNRLVERSFKFQFTLNHKHVCINRGRNLSIIIAVTSSASHLESRLAIRDTWGNFAKAKGAKVLFFLGQPKNRKYHSRIIDENTKFQDIIVSSFLDTYANLTIKTISMLKWVSEVCSFVKYVLKVDDDMFINVENIINITQSRNFSMTILGELAHDWSPVRSKKSKWYTSHQDYPFNIYPDFVFGPCYLLTGDSINLLYNSSIRMKFFHLEDVYVTGFVAEKENIQRVNLPAMFNTPKDLQPCNFKRLLSSHGHTPPDMRRHWMWLNRRNFQCG